MLSTLFFLSESKGENPQKSNLQAGF